MLEPNQPIASIARSLAAALWAAAENSNAHDEPQKKISELEKELIEAYRAELAETLEF
jgi:hypothetical protein